MLLGYGVWVYNVVRYMKKLPVDMSTFSRMIQEGYLYVDKTRYIYDLFKGGGRYFFLSRPRRFGKSLLISTLKALFLGKRELFKDLWIGKHSDYEWKEYQVIHLDLSDADTETAVEFKISLGRLLDDISAEYGIDVSKRITPKEKLRILVKKLAETSLVVILIDEYDKPILDHIQDPQRARAHRAVLKNFYDGFKGLDAYLRAVFITGVSKFAKTSIFSGLNNLNEISYEPEAAQLVGYSEAELMTNFAEYIEEIAHERNEKMDELLKKIRYWYNGYQFSEVSVKIYNPFSIVYFLTKRKFKNYWFESGTPTFLVDLLKQHPQELKDIESKVFNLTTLGTFRTDKVPLATLFFQTGYLTIKEYDNAFNVYRLGYPNEEINQSLSLLEVGVLTDLDIVDVDNACYQLKHSLEHKDMDSFISVLHSLFASIPFNLHVDREAHYHALFQLLCNLLGFENHCEVSTSKGKVDMTLITAQHVYIFEFKFNQTGAAALSQILEKRYYEPYLRGSKDIVLVGVSFNTKNKALMLDFAQGIPPLQS